MPTFHLTPRTQAKLDELRQIQADMAEMQVIANVLLTVAPFRSIIDGFGWTDPIEITTSEFALVKSASEGLSSHFKSQLRFFCESEAISMQNTEGEKRFWRQMSKQFR